MREIKFKFIYGIDGEKETYFSKVFSFAEIENGLHIDEICDSPLLKDYSILAKLQYTGLKDKSGVEIYDGSICDHFGKDVLIDWDDCYMRYAMIYGRKKSGWLTKEKAKSLVVVGNKFTRPGLLEQ